jgi:transcription elongation factor Elf1
MSELILTTTALKVVNKGGGRLTKTIVREVKNVFGVAHREHVHAKTKTRKPGADYVVFNCPACLTRNKQWAGGALQKTGEDITFKCTHCRRQIVVNRPIDSIPISVVSR